VPGARLGSWALHSVRTCRCAIPSKDYDERKSAFSMYGKKLLREGANFFGVITVED
jgi:hypothetical protein